MGNGFGGRGFVRFRRNGLRSGLGGGLFGRFRRLFLRCRRLGGRRRGGGARAFLAHQFASLRTFGAVGFDRRTAGRRHFGGRKTALASFRLRAGRLFGGFEAHRLRVDQILRGHGNRRVVAVHAAEGRHRIDREHFRTRGRGELRADHEFRGIVAQEGVGVLFFKAHDELLHRAAFKDGPVEFRDRPDRHVRDHVEGLRRIEPVQGHVVAHDGGRIASLLRQATLQGLHFLRIARGGHRDGGSRRRFGGGGGRRHRAARQVGRDRKMTVFGVQNVLPNGDVAAHVEFDQEGKAFRAERFAADHADRDVVVGRGVALELQVLHLFGPGDTFAQVGSRRRHAHHRSGRRKVHVLDREDRVKRFTRHRADRHFAQHGGRKAAREQERTKEREGRFGKSHRSCRGPIPSLRVFCAKDAEDDTALRPIPVRARQRPLLNASRRPRGRASQA